MLRGILVARVSTKAQATDEHYSLEVQLRLMRECCERRGIEIVEERIEPGTSAFTSDLRSLPELNRSVEDIEAGLANALVMHESSRLARNEQLANHILDRLEACGASYVNASGAIDYSTPEGRAFFNSEAGMNAYQSRKTSEHSKKGKRQQFLNGLPVGRIPFGYESQVNEDGRVNRSVPPVPVPREAELTRKAFQDRALGRSDNDTAKEWNSLGSMPRSVRGVTRFSKQTIRAILSNPFYKGEVTHLGETRRGLHEPIVTDEEWEAAQRPRRRVTRRRHPPVLLQGIATCLRCYKPIYPSRPAKGAGHPGERYSYYRESSLDFNRDCIDAGCICPTEVIDVHVDELMRSMTMSPEWLEYVRQESRRPNDGATDKRTGLEETLRRVQKDYFRQRLSDSEYEEMRRQLEGELSLLPTNQRVLTEALAHFESFADLWEQGSAEARNETCKLVLERVVLDMRNKEVVEVRPHSEFEPLFSLRRGLYVTDISPAPGSP